MKLYNTGNTKKNMTSLLIYQYLGLLVSNFTMEVEEGLFIFGSYSNNWLTESLYLLIVTGLLINVLIIPYGVGWLIDEYIKYKYNLKKFDLLQMILTMPLIFYIAFVWYPKIAYNF